MQATSFTHVIFDMDGTLLNTLDDLANACNHVCEQRGWPTFDVDAYRYKVGNGQPKLIERIMPAEFLGDQAVFEQALEDFRVYYGVHREDNTAPYEGIVSMLDALVDAGIPIAVLSNKDHAATVPLAKQYFGDRFAIVQGRVDEFPPKPEAPVTQHVLELLGADPSTTLYVGDSNVDMLCGHNAGMRSCGVTWGFRSREELADAGADYLVDTTDELLDVIFGC